MTVLKWTTASEFKLESLRGFKIIYSASQYLVEQHKSTSPYTAIECLGFTNGTERYLFYCYCILNIYHRYLNLSLVESIEMKTWPRAQGITFYQFFLCEIQGFYRLFKPVYIVVLLCGKGCQNCIM